MAAPAARALAEATARAPVAQVTTAVGTVMIFFAELVQVVTAVTGDAVPAVPVQRPTVYVDPVIEVAVQAVHLVAAEADEALQTFNL